MTTAEQCLALFTECAAEYPSARFLVIAIAPDGSDAVELGWGLALPEYVLTDLPEVGLTGRFRSAARLTQILGRTMDVRLIWVDPEPDPWPDEPKQSTVEWGRSVLEPTRGHIREASGMAICGALLVGDLDVAAGEFDKCSVCLENLG